MPLLRRFVPLIAVTLPLAAQQLPKPPSDSALAAITARGRMLVAYDIAAWHGGDAIEALKPQPGEVTQSMAIRHADGTWTLYYGRLTEKKDTFYITYRADQVTGDSGFRATREATPKADVTGLREMAIAIETAQRQFGKVSRPYNTYVIPLSGKMSDGVWVYILPAQTNPRIFPLGGDVRYHIVNGTTIADSVRFHRAILERQTGTTQNGGSQVASMHTSFDSIPSETDVFVVLRQSPHLPELVATQNFHYEISTTGAITYVRAQQQTGAIAPPPPPPPSAPPLVWTPKYDTVGSAPRVMSPGYTQWRDTTTGWRMSLDRIIPLRTPDSAPYVPSWRSVILPDGRFVVTRTYPSMPIQLYDASGQFVREIGKLGSGPSEYENTPTVAVKGDTLFAFDGIRSRVLSYTLDGQFIRSFNVAGVRGSPIPIAIDPRGYVRIEQHFGLGPNDSLSRKQWLYYNTRGTLVDSLRRPVLPAPKTWTSLDGARIASIEVPLSPAVADVFLPNGELMYGVANRFEFFVTRNGRDTTHIFGKSNVAPIAVTTGFVDTTMADMLRGNPPFASAVNRKDMPAFFPLWNSANVDEKGFVWVSIGLRGRTPANVAIFHPDGRYLGIAPLWWERMDWMAFGADRMAYVGYDSNRKPVLRVYRIERRGN